MSMESARLPPAHQRHQRPYGLDNSERPCALQKPIDRAQRAGDGKGEDEPRAAFFQRVENQHGRDGEESKGIKRFHCGTI